MRGNIFDPDRDITVIYVGTEEEWRELVEEWGRARARRPWWRRWRRADDAM